MPFAVNVSQASLIVLSSSAIFHMTRRTSSSLSANCQNMCLGLLAITAPRRMSTQNSFPFPQQ